MTFLRLVWHNIAGCNARLSTNEEEEAGRAGVEVGHHSAAEARVSDQAMSVRYSRRCAPESASQP